LNALLIYDTITGHTQRAAEDIAAALQADGMQTRLASAKEVKDWDALDADIVVVGSPCHAGSCRIRGGVSSPIRSLLKRLKPAMLAGKVAGAFAVNCAYGGHVTVGAIEKVLRAAGARLPEPGVVVRAGVPFSVAVGPMASEEARERLREFGRALAEAARAAGGAR